MNVKLREAIIFTSGVAVGGIAAYFVAMDIAEKEAQVQLDELRKKAAAFNMNKPDISDIAPTREQTEEKESFTEIVSDYTSTDTHEREEVETVPPIREPKLISKDEFYAEDSNRRVFLMYYYDDILANNMDVVIDIDVIGGYENLDELEHEDGACIYIRNFSDGLVYCVEYTTDEYYVITGINPNDYPGDEDYE